MVNSSSGGKLAVSENPAVNEAVITLEHTFGDEPHGRVVITDGTGKAVFTDADATFPYVWNLKGNDGSQVPDGVYSVTAYLHAAGHYGVAEPAEIVVFRK